MAGRDHGMDFAQEVLGSHLAPVPVAVTWEGCITAVAGLDGTAWW